MAYDKAQLQQQLSALEARFGTFQERRRHYDDLIHRSTYVDLESSTTGSLDPVQYANATLEKDLFDDIDILTDNPTRWDAVCYDTSEAAKKAERRFVLWLAAGWSEVNEGRWWDSAVAEGQARHGVKVTWNRWYPRNRKGRRKFPFYLSNTHIYGCYWTDNNRLIDLFVYKYKVPIVESGVTNSEGKRVTFDSLGKIGWLGRDEAHNLSTTYGKEIEVIVCDYRALDGEMCPLEDCDHPMRYISVYVCADGAKLEDAEDVETYPSPFERCSFKVTGGRFSYHETDPHQIHRPLMLPSMDVAEKRNYFGTLLATQTVLAYGDEDMYLDYSAAGPHIKLPEGGEKQTFQRPEKGSNEMAAYPGEIKRFPKNIDPHLMKQIEQLDVLEAEFRPNRFMTGNAATEASNATGTAFLASMQQAGLPFGNLLSKSDTTIKEIAEDWVHALKYWAIAEKDDASEYPLALSGEEPVMRYGRSIKRGEVISLNPKTDLSYDFKIILKTESRTKAELKEAWVVAYEMFKAGVYTTEDLMKEAGIFDIEAQEEALYAQHVRQTLQPMEDSFMQQYILRVASNKAGIDFSQFMPMAPGAESQDPGGMPPVGKTNVLQTPGAQQRSSTDGIMAQVNGATPDMSGGSEPGY